MEKGPGMAEGSSAFLPRDSHASSLGATAAGPIPNPIPS